MDVYVQCICATQLRSVLVMAILGITVVAKIRSERENPTPDLLFKYVCVCWYAYCVQKKTKNKINHGHPVIKFTIELSVSCKKPIEVP